MDGMADVRAPGAALAIPRLEDGFANMREPLRRLAESVVNEMMSVETDRLCEATGNGRSGCRERGLVTCVGTLAPPESRGCARAASSPTTRQGAARGRPRARRAPPAPARGRCRRWPPRWAWSGCRRTRRAPCASTWTRMCFVKQKRTVVSPGIERCRHGNRTSGVQFPCLNALHGDC